jgi:hypothetical protein
MQAYHGPSQYAAVSVPVYGRTGEKKGQLVAWNHYVADMVTDRLITTLGAFGVFGQAVKAAEGAHHRAMIRTARSI